MVFCSLTAVLDPSTTTMCYETQILSPGPHHMTWESISMDASSPRQKSHNQQWVADFFRLHVRLYGNDWRALGWQSRGTQIRRFEVLAEIGPLAQTRILDVGSGLGDLYGYFCAHEIWVTYTGY